MVVCWLRFIFYFRNEFFLHFALIIIISKKICVSSIFDYHKEKSPLILRLHCVCVREALWQSHFSKALRIDFENPSLNVFNRETVFVAHTSPTTDPEFIVSFLNSGCSLFSTRAVQSLGFSDSQMQQIIWSQFSLWTTPVLLSFVICYWEFGLLLDQFWKWSCSFWSSSLKTILGLYCSAARCYLFSFFAAISCIISLMYIDIYWIICCIRYCIKAVYQCIILLFRCVIYLMLL